MNRYSTLGKIITHLKDPLHSSAIHRWTLGWFRSRIKSYCPICGTAGRFAFSASGDPRRENVGCQKCGSAERQRFMYLYLKSTWNIDKTGNLGGGGG
jgi:hypothetical protein